MDFRSRPAFRALKAALGAGQEATAAGLVTILFNELAYSAVDQPLGFLPERHWQMLSAELGMPAWLAALTAEGGYLRPADGGWQCPEFAEGNKHCAPGHMTVQERGAHGRAVKFQRARAEEQAAQQALFLKDDLYQRPDGTRMDAEEIHRALAIIKLCDNALGRSARLNSDFSTGLIQDAWRVRREFTDDEINDAAIYLNKNKGHASLPVNTEALLRNFRRYV
jgi:hypothetical protein